MRSGRYVAARALSRRTLSLKPAASPISVVMSRNWMPGFGKSGIVRTSDARSRSGRGGRAIMSSQSPCPYGSMLLVGPDVPVRQIGQHREDQQEAEERIADKIGRAQD